MAVLQMCFISQLFVWMAEEQYVLQWVCFIFTVIIGVLWCVENAIMLIAFGTWNIVAGVLGFTYMMIYVDDLFWYGDYKCLRFSEQVLILQVFILLTTIVLIIYPSLEFDADLHMLLDLRMYAIEQRMLAVKDYPGQQFLSRDAAATIVARAVRLVGTDSYDDVIDENSGPVQFRHDKRLLLPSYNYNSKEQGLAYFDSLHTKTFLVRGESRWPPAVTIDFDQLAKILEEKVLPGSHHLHLDPETRVEVAQSIHDFMSRE
eukprot:gene5384-5773_t